MKNFSATYWTRRKLLQTSLLSTVLASPVMGVRSQAPIPQQNRVIFVYTPYGAPYELWQPDDCGDHFSLRSASAPLEPVKQHCVFFRNFLIENSGPGIPDATLGGWFTSGRETTLDIRLGEAWNQGVQLPYLHMGAHVTDSVSKKDNQKIIFSPSAPALYDMLFPNNDVDPAANHPFDEKFRETLSVGPVNFDHEVDSQIELSVLALTRKVTNVITLMWGDYENSFFLPNYPNGLPHLDFRHAVVTSTPLYALFRAYMSAKLAYLIQLLAVLRDESGQSLLNTTLVVHVSDEGDGRSHSGNNAPYLIAGGKNLFRNGAVLDVGRATQYDLMDTIGGAYGLDVKYGTRVIEGLRKV